MRVPRLTHMAAALVATGALAFTVPSASADTGPVTLAEAKARAEAQSGKMDCFVGNINNGDNWTAYAQNPPHPGQAIWYEYGDKLKISDSRSDGTRTIGGVRWCYDGSWSNWHDYDSGPNEGNIDTRWKDFDLKEGRKVQVISCAKSGSGVSYCGPKVEDANA